jgi:hypothetical protein
MQFLEHARYRPALPGCYRLMVGLAMGLCCVSTLGCSLFPDIRHKPQYHNPFPQISRVAILPFANQSNEPTLRGSRVSEAYYNELQSIPGFEVLPLGVVENQILEFEQYVLQRPMQTPTDFQQFAQRLGVDAVLQGAVTDFDSYYPPRLTLKVNWYAANPGFHPIPEGYGLPWGTKAEKDIPESIRLEAERALATAQLATQTPVAYDHPTETWPAQAESPAETKRAQSNSTQSNSIPTNNAAADDGTLEDDSASAEKEAVRQIVANDDGLDASRVELADLLESDAIGREVGGRSPSVRQQPSGWTGMQSTRIDSTRTDSDAGVLESEAIKGQLVGDGGGVDSMGVNSTGVDPAGLIARTRPPVGELPVDWPDPQGFVPAEPQPTRPVMRPQSLPIISHMKAYNGHDEDFTERLSEYFYFRDDVRFGGPHAYLQRSEDFIRFCCHEHVVETLASRGGELESRLILNWPIDRYER